jgi:hypothetical protein
MSGMTRLAGACPRTVLSTISPTAHFIGSTIVEITLNLTNQSDQIVVFDLNPV